MKVTDLIKISYVKEGYLPNWPYHLISDEEMCDAFINYDSESEDGWEQFLSDDNLCYFKYNYPLLDASMESQYKDLVEAIAYHIRQLKDSKDAEYVLPDWIYSYMMGAVIGVNSSQLDKHDMFVSLNADNIDDEYDVKVGEACYARSKEWLGRLPQVELDHRPPTMYGEPHVLKYLRLLDVGTVIGTM